MSFCQPQKRSPSGQTRRTAAWWRSVQGGAHTARAHNRQSPGRSGSRPDWHLLGLAAPYRFGGGYTFEVANPRFPGEDFIRKGIADLANGTESVEALLVSIGAPRLKRIGLKLPRTTPSAEQRLYELLAQSDVDSAHSRYNALVRRLVSFERAAECAARR